MVENIHNSNQPSGSGGLPNREDSRPVPFLTENTASNMEVHHHPDLHHKKKKFKEYFLEFLMIFLAVTLGFFAESLREHISDGEKEHEYMQSFLNNLRDDYTALVNIMSENEYKALTLDSLIRLFGAHTPNDTLIKMMYTYAARSIGYYSVFRTNDATMQQLKNCGGLRFIKKAHVADSIAKYDGEVKIMYAAENLYNTATEHATAAAQEMFDNTIYYDSSFFNNHAFTGKPLKLLTTDPQRMKFFFNKVISEKGFTKNYIRNLQERLPFLQSLMLYLREQYKLE